MRSKDVYPNRLEFAKKKIVTLLEKMPNDELSLLAFAHATFMLAPFTSDKSTLEQIIEGVDDNYINMGSTDFTALANFSKKVLKNKKEKILILFSDGGEREALNSFRKILKEHRISLYVVLVGSKKGAKVINKDGEVLIYQGKSVITRRNDVLGAVAEALGGAYVLAHTGKNDIEDLVKKIKNQHQSDNKGEIRIHDRVELFYFPLALGLLFLLIALSSFPRRDS
jgi:Ca-activated chloride channel family protein